MLPPGQMCMCACVRGDGGGGAAACGGMGEGTPQPAATQAQRSRATYGLSKVRVAAQAPTRHTQDTTHTVTRSLTTNHPGTYNSCSGYVMGQGKGGYAGWSGSQHTLGTRGLGRRRQSRSLCTASHCKTGL